jgi:small GTP-binding protein
MQRIKVILVGECKVGKTCLVNRYTKLLDFQPGATVGVARTSHLIDSRTGTASLDIWDTAGQEQYRSLMPFYFQKANVAIIVFDLSERSSFDSLPAWVNMVNDHAPENVVRILVGNKSDLAGAAIDPEEIDAMAARLEAKAFFRASAVNGEGVSELFDWISQQDIPRDPDFFSSIREEESFESVRQDTECAC